MSYAREVNNALKSSLIYSEEVIVYEIYNEEKDEYVYKTTLLSRYDGDERNIRAIFLNGEREDCDIPLDHD